MEPITKHDLLIAIVRLIIMVSFALVLLFGVAPRDPGELGPEVILKRRFNNFLRFLKLKK